MKFLSISMSIFALLLTSNAALSQQSVNQFSSAKLTETVKKDTTVRKVGFRLSNWRTVHGDSSDTTANTVKTLKQIGCEVRQENHGDHVDVSFRCLSWRSIKVNDEKSSNQWQEWLVQNKFETVVLNPGKESKLPTVKVRMPDWKTIHARDSNQAKSLKNTYEMIGCEVKIDNHGNHIDLKFRSTKWNTIALPNSQAAHVWEDWLKKTGFETQHDHSSDNHSHKH